MSNYITFIDFIPFIILLTIGLICVYSPPSKNSRGFKVLFWAMLIFSTIRYKVGYDFGVYERIVEGDIQDLERIEWLSKIFVLIGRNTFTQVFFIINAVIVMLCFSKAAQRLSVNPTQSLFFFMTFTLFFLNTMNIIRNGTAVLMSMYACMLFLDRKYVWAAVVAFLAAGVHLSAFIIFLVPLIYYFRQGRWINILMFITSFGVGMFVKSTVLTILLSDSSDRSEYISNYVLNYETEGLGPYKYVFYMINIAFFIFWDKIVKAAWYNKFLLNMVNFGVCIWSAFSFQATMSYRFSLFFTIWMVILIPSVLSTFPIRSRGLVKHFVIFCFAALFMLNLFLLASAFNNGIIDQASFLPYRVFFLQ